MKKVFAFITLSLFLFTGCSQEKQENSSSKSSISSSKTESVITHEDENTNSYLDKYVETFPKYNFEGKNEATFDDRYFNLVIPPQNIAEELVTNNYYYDIAGEFEKLLNIFGENESLKITATNTKENFQDGIYIKEYIVKSLSVLQKAEFESEISPIAVFIENDVERYKLTEFTVVRVEISMSHSQKALNLGPQLGDGDYIRSFLCGKSESVDEWKIYEVYWE